MLSFVGRNVSITTKQSLHQSRKVEKNVCVMTTHQTLGHAVRNTFLDFHFTPQPCSSVCPIIFLSSSAKPHPTHGSTHSLEESQAKNLSREILNQPFLSDQFFYYQNKFLLGHCKSYKWPSQITCVRPTCISAISQCLELKEWPPISRLVGQGAGKWKKLGLGDWEGRMESPGSLHKTAVKSVAMPPRFPFLWHLPFISLKISLINYDYFY